MRVAIWSALVLSALLVSACGNGSDSRAAAAAPMSVTLSRSELGKHNRVAAAITTRRAAGVRGKTIANYSLAAMAVDPRTGCVNNRDRRFPDGPRGARVSAELDPTRGKGGPEGWCPGRYRGTVTYFTGFACPAKGTCHPPKGFPTRSQIVARFSFRVG